MASPRIVFNVPTPRSSQRPFLSLMGSRAGSGLTAHLASATPRASMGPPSPKVSVIAVNGVRSEAAVDEMIDRMVEAQAAFRLMTQYQVDLIFEKAAMAATKSRVRLAKMAIEEGGMGILEDKTIKNHFSSEYTYNRYKDTKTCGVVESDEFDGFVHYAEPIGILAAITPCTNPTATTIFKCLLALKTRNCIIISPHRRTAKCSIAAAELIRDAAVAAGAPQDCIGWIDQPGRELCVYMMRHPKVAMILATGAGGLVKAAYSSGKPALGGGAGNTPVVIDETADIPTAVNSILLSKTFDNGMICASEQAVIVSEAIAEAVKIEFVKRGAYFLDADEKKLVGDYLLSDAGVLNPSSVGQPAWKVAELAGVKNHPTGCRLLLADLDSIGPAEKLSHEKLCPILGFYAVPDYLEALQTALRVVQYGGLGHTSVLYTDTNGPQAQERIDAFQSAMPTSRTLICMPTSQGAIGDLFNFRQSPSLSLGCGSWGSNATSEGLQVKHLLNYKQVCQRRNHILWYKVPGSVYLNRGTIKEALKCLRQYDLSKAFIVTDPGVQAAGHVDRVTEGLRAVGVSCDIFADIFGAVDTATLNRGSSRMERWNPDVVVAIGGGTVIDAAKLMRLKYEHPDVDLEALGAPFMDIHKRMIKFPKLGTKVKKVMCIPTTSGSGAEMSPFASLLDSATGELVVVTDYALTPDIAVMDSDFVLSMSSVQAASSGFQALAGALEAYVSMFATEFTLGHCFGAVRLLLRNLGKSVHKGDPIARETCHHAASMAGMAISNAFLGIAHSLANQLTGRFGINRGFACAMVLCQVIKFNAEDAPSKQGTFPQYTHPKAKQQYAELADILNLGAEEDEAGKVDSLVQAIDELKSTLEIPHSLKEYGVPEDAFMSCVDSMALGAFDDQCTGSNPRYPLVSELRQLLIDAYFGKIRYLHLETVHNTLARRNSLLDKMAAP